jgi:nicotinamidase-related amidase
MTIVTLDRSQVAVLLVDPQSINWTGVELPKEPELVRLENLIRLADWLDLPLIATFEHPVERNGMFPERLEKVYPERGLRFTKRTYNCCLEPTILAAIKALPGNQIAVAGAETDVCIMQSVLGLLNHGCQVFLLEDCLYTTEPQPRPALDRMYRAGAIPSTFKSFAYELAVSVDHSPWLDTWIERERSYAKPFPEDFEEPELLPPWEPKI